MQWKMASRPPERPSYVWLYMDIWISSHPITHPGQWDGEKFRPFLLDGGEELIIDFEVLAWAEMEAPEDPNELEIC